MPESERLQSLSLSAFSLRMENALWDSQIKFRNLVLWTVLRTAFVSAVAVLGWQSVLAPNVWWVLGSDLLLLYIFSRLFFSFDRHLASARETHQESVTALERFRLEHPESSLDSEIVLSFRSLIQRLGAVPMPLGDGGLLSLFLFVANFALSAATLIAVIVWSDQPEPSAFISLLKPTGAAGEVARRIVQLTFLAHVLLCSLVLVWFWFVGRSRLVSLAPSQRGIARESYFQFLAGFSVIWLVWLLLYVWLAVTVGGRITDQFRWIVADALSAASSAAFFWCFLVLDKPSVPTIDDPYRAREFVRYLAGIVVVSALVFLLSLADRLLALPIQGVGVLASSAFSGVTAMYLFGKLNSNRLGINRIYLAPLYLYSLLQLSFAQFSVATSPPVFDAVMFVVALVLKIYFLFVVMRVLVSGGLSHYFEVSTDVALGGAR